MSKTILIVDEIAKHRKCDWDIAMSLLQSMPILVADIKELTRRQAVLITIPVPWSSDQIHTALPRTNVEVSAVTTDINKALGAIRGFATEEDARVPGTMIVVLRYGDGKRFGFIMSTDK